ncbi:MAG: hypothetical protein WBN93_10530, partial [Acidimicrobiia bacterium]
MADKDDSVRQDGWTGAEATVPDDVAAAAKANADAPAESTSGRPRWVNEFVWQSLWKVVGVGLLVTLGLV